LEAIGARDVPTQEQRLENFHSEPNGSEYKKKVIPVYLTSLLFTLASLDHILILWI
jgi:hypothetical protein